MTSGFTGRFRSSLGDLGPGSRVAGYLIEEQIGSGGMAVVFRARDQLLDRLAAVKVIAPSMADDPEFRVRFLRESRAAAAVESPHIIPVYGAGESDGLLYIATRYVAGGDLAALLRRAGGRLAPNRAASLLAQVASALDAAHTADLVHRDVKPQNILVDTGPDDTEHAFLSDFGLSKGTRSPTNLTLAGQFVGTPDYCAPEQIRSRSVDGRADQYALACVAFALLTGGPPYQCDDIMATLFAQVNDPVPRVTGQRPELPVAVDGVVARGMAKAPGDRYGNCSEFVTALREALASAGPSEGLQAEASGGQRSPTVDAHAPLLSPATGDGSTISKDRAGPGHRRATWGTPAQRRRRRTAVLAGMAAAVLVAAGIIYAMNLPASPHGTPLAGSSLTQGAGRDAKPTSPTKSGSTSAGQTASAAATESVRTTGPWTGPFASPGVTGYAPAAPCGAAFTSNTGQLVIASSDVSYNDHGDTDLWNLVTRKIIATFPTDQSASTCTVVFSSGDKTLATIGRWGIYLWNFATRKEITYLANPDGSASNSAVFEGTNEIATGTAGGHVYLWNISAHKVVASLDLRNSAVFQLVNLSGYSEVAVAGGDAYLCLWNLQSQSCSPIVDGNDISTYSYFSTAAFDSNTGILAVGSAAGPIYLWDAVTGETIGTLNPPSPEGSFSFNPQRGILAAADGNDVVLWNMSDRTIEATIPGPDAASIQTVAFSPDGSTIAVGDVSGKTYLLNVAKYFASHQQG